MAEIQDEVDLDVGEIEAVQAEEVKKAPKPEEPELPEKYRGKSVAELAKMHQEVERLAGKNAQEADEVRRLADELLKSQLRGSQVDEKPIEVDFFENPEEAIRNAVNNNPKVLAAEQASIRAQQELATRKTAEKHPDYLTLVQDADFNEWVGKSKIRTQLYQLAANFNADAADELFSTYKELRAVKKAQQNGLVAEIDTASRDKSLNAAAVDTSGSGESYKKVYRRADLIRLKIKDPAKFSAMQDEIDKAYQEGRVR